MIERTYCEEPECVDACPRLFSWELDAPLAALCVCFVLPGGLDATLEQVVVRFLGQDRGGNDVAVQAVWE